MLHAALNALQQLTLTDWKDIIMIAFVVGVGTRIELWARWKVREIENRYPLDPKTVQHLPLAASHAINPKLVAHLQEEPPPNV